jgi:hypothetical protein
MISQLTHSTLTLNVANEASLCIPWDSPYDYGVINDPGITVTNTVKQSWGGILGIFNDLNIFIGDGSAPTWVLYASFHDLKVYGETPPLSVYAQMDMLDHVADKVIELANADREDEIAPMGEISLPLHLGANIIGYASDKFGSWPVLSQGLRVASWFTRWASRAAAAFGFSRPPVLTTASRMWMQNSGYAHIADMEDYAVPLGLLNDNHVLPDTRVMDNADEMSLEFILSRPSPLFRISWAASSAAGVTIASAPTAPTNLVWTSSSVASTVILSLTGLAVGFFPSNIAYLGSMFKSWRGDMIFSFRVAKTPFHGGRLIIGWVPVSSANIANTASITQYFGPPNTNNLYISTVWDIKAKNEIEFTVPYISPSPYRDSSSATGMLFVRVLDPLVAPANVANQVEMIISVRAASNFEFSVPRTSQIWIPAPASITSVAAQMDMSGGGSSPSPPQPNAASPEKICDSTPSLYCIGEIVTSLKQLCLRGGIYITGTTNAARNIVTPPWQLYGATGGSTGITTFSNLDYIAAVGAMFAYFAGSYCIDIVPYNNTTSINVGLVEYATVDAYCNLVGKQISDTLDATPLIIENGGKAVHVKMPYYNLLRHMPVALDSSAETYYFTTFGNQPPPTASFTASWTGKTGVDNTTYVGRRLADDARFHRFLGPPICYYGLASTGVNTLGQTYFTSVTTGTPI